MLGIAIRRGPAWEDEHGNLIFQCTVPMARKAEFFERIAGFELLLMAQDTPIGPTPSNRPPARDQESEPLIVSVKGADEARTGFGAGAGPVPRDIDLIQDILELPPFQEWAMLCHGAQASAVADSLQYAADFLQERVGRPLNAMTYEDCLPVVNEYLGWLKLSGRLS